MLDWHSRKKLEARRTEALSDISGEQVSVELMAQRPRRAEDTLDGTLFTKILQRLMEIKESAKQATNCDDLGDLIDDAEKQGQLRAYLCPIGEISDEGSLTIDVMEEWNLPQTVISKLRDLLGKKLKDADKDPGAARSGLRALFEEYDSWASYTNDYEETMQRYARRLFSATIALILLAILAFHFPLTFFPLTFLGGLLSAGAAGSCISVLAKLPVFDVSLSGELDAYGRRILSRIGAGFAASLIGCALLGWGLLPISIQNQSFADVLNACAASPTTSCTGLKTLILLGVPMLFGFSERALTSFEQRVFGNSKGGRAKR